MLRILIAEDDQELCQLFSQRAFSAAHDPDENDVFFQVDAETLQGFSVNFFLQMQGFAPF